MRQGVGEAYPTDGRFAFAPGGGNGETWIAQTHAPRQWWLAPCQRLAQTYGSAGGAAQERGGEV